jgi:hypothetical protein
MGYNEYERLMAITQSSVFNSSQSGSGSNFRNTSFNGGFFVLNSDWCSELPAMGKVRFDYVSLDRTAALMPTSSWLKECHRMTKSLNTPTATNTGTTIDLLLDIIFSRQYVKQLRRIIRNQRIVHKNSCFALIEDSKNTILEYFTTGKVEQLEDVSDDSEEELRMLIRDDEKEDEEEANINKQNPLEKLKTQPLLQTRSNRGATVVKKAAIMNHITNDHQHTPKSVTRLKSRVDLSNITSTYIVYAMDLWVDFAKTSWEKYKLSHIEYLSTKVPKQTDLSNSKQVNEHKSTSNKSATKSPKQPIYQSITIVVKRRGGLVKANVPTDFADSIHNMKVRVMLRKASSSASSHSLLRVTKMAVTDVNEEEATDSSVACSRFEPILIHLEICLLYNIWIETYQVI